MRNFLAIIGLSFFLLCCKQQPTAPASQWHCSTIADQPEYMDSTGQFRAVAYKTKFWPVGYEFKVGFVGGNAAQIALVKSACAEWSSKCNLKFTFPATGPFDLRVGFASGGGAWSYVGTDNKFITSGPTMNLGWYAKDTYLHEFGHAIGLLHEHQNPSQPIKWNEPNVIRDLSGPPNNWTLDMIKFNVLNPYPLPNVITTALDKRSIMMYPIPASWTLDGFTSPGGLEISQVDATFVAQQYPFTQPPATGNVVLRSGQVDTLLEAQKNVNLSFQQVAKQLGELSTLTTRYMGRK